MRQPGLRVDPGDADQKIPVQVIARGKSCGANLAQNIAWLHQLTGFHQDAAEVIVTGMDAQAVIQNNSSPAHIQNFSNHNFAGGRG